MEHKSCDGFPVEVGKRFWDNNLRVVQVKRAAVSSNSYADTGETQTWHDMTMGGWSDTLTSTMQPYGRLVRRYGGKDAEGFPVGTSYADTK